MAVLLIYGLGGLLVLGVAVATYAYAQSTRRRAQCSNCGEVVKMEHDRVRHCPSCGALLS